MKVTIVGQEPVYIDEPRARELMKRLANGAEYVIIDGGMYKASTITAITEGEKPKPEARIGGVAKGTGGVKLIERGVLDGNNFKKYKETRRRLGL